jgi:hypothetical protein
VGLPDGVIEIDRVKNNAPGSRTALGGGGPVRRKLSNEAIKRLRQNQEAGVSERL